jgi:TRAP-type C4-dicarboxylate transport system substrate-binding protein
MVRKDVWEKIPADVRPKLLAIGQELGDKIDAEVRRLNQDAVAAMQKQGLKLVQSDAAAWRAAMETTPPAIRGGVVPAAFFDQLRAARETCSGEGKK